MLKPEDRIRSEKKFFNGVSYIRHVHKCHGCGCEILRSVTEERTKSGYCKICAPKHRKVKNNLNKDGHKHCNICNRFLPTDKFMKKGNNKKGFSSACTKCHNLKKFGINSIEFENLLLKQNNLCAICNKKEAAFDKVLNGIRALAVDHCHKTNKVRGLLCTNCNITLGQVKDDIEILKNAIEYLIKHNGSLN